MPHEGQKWYENSFIHSFIFLFTYKACDTNKQSQFTMQFGPV